MSDGGVRRADQAAFRSRPPDERRVVAAHGARCWSCRSPAGVGLLVAVRARRPDAARGRPALRRSLPAIGFSLILWGKYLFPPEIVTEPRGEHESSEAERLEAERVYLEGERQIGRRSLLVRMMVGAFGALGLAADLPDPLAGAEPGRSLFETAWTAGARGWWTQSGEPIRVDDLDVGRRGDGVPGGVHRPARTRRRSWCASMPERARPAGGPQPRSARGQRLLLEALHARGCPVGLYLAEMHQLQCPCHFSAFDVLNGAQPTFGPAARPLPQLPLDVDDQGYLVREGRLHRAGRAGILEPG